MSRHSDPDLAKTEKNMAFVRAVILDMHGDKAKADHYKEIFGSKAERLGLVCMASRLWNSPAMKKYAAEVRADMRKEFMVTIESLTAELEEARQVGKANDAAGPMVAATMGKAKLYGLDKQIIEHRGDIPVGAVTIEVVSARPENNGN